jgi:transcription antitermination factor NusG
MTPSNDNASRFIATTSDIERAGVADDPLVWFAVQANPNCEVRAEAGLIERGFVVYLPRETRWHRATRRGKAEAKREPKSRPLMVGYLFVGMCGLQSVYHARQTDGVRGMVGVNGKPTAIPERFIKRLKDREDRGYFDETRPITGRHKAGDSVTVTEGVFTGQLGEVLASIADGKLRIEIAGLFGGASVEVDDDHVEARAA